MTLKKQQAMVNSLLQVTCEYSQENGCMVVVAKKKTNVYF